MATAAAVAPTKLRLTETEKEKLKTGPIEDIKKYIDVFTVHFCRQYEIEHWQEDVAAECYLWWWRATQNQKPSKNGLTIAENMNNPQYAKRVIYARAIEWEKRYRKENHTHELDSLHEAAAKPTPLQFGLDLSGLNDVEKLILELRYGFGRGEDGGMPITQIARELKHSKDWVYERHNKALKILKASLQ
jgi:DNA-directed RNA polymerase specialized sigma24 family protein